MRKRRLTAYLYAFSSTWGTAGITHESVLYRLPGAGSAGERRPEAKEALHEVQQVAVWCPEPAAYRSSLPMVVPHLLQGPCPKSRHRQIQPSSPLPSYEWILRPHRDSNGIPQRLSYLQGMLCWMSNKMPRYQHTVVWGSECLNQQTPRSRVLPEQLIHPQLVKKYTAFYGTWRFITFSTKVHHWTLS